MTTVFDAPKRALTQRSEKGDGRPGADRPAAWTRSATKVHGEGETEVRALDQLDVAFEAARFSAIMGPSGSGKSTLLQCMAGLDRLSDGETYIGTTNITSLGERDLTRLRRDHLGFVFQAFNLVPTLNARENITLPLDLAGRRPDPDWLQEVISIVGLGDRLDHRPSELSGGQQQRVAVARALAARPAVVFADEPTGNLDSRAGREVLSFLRRSVDEHGQTVIMVTHDPMAAASADRVVFLADGRAVDELSTPDPDAVLDQMLHLGHQSPRGGETDA